MKKSETAAVASPAVTDSVSTPLPLIEAPKVEIKPESTTAPVINNTETKSSASLFTNPSNTLQAKSSSVFTGTSTNLPEKVNNILPKATGTNSLFTGSPSTFTDGFTSTSPNILEKKQGVLMSVPGALVLKDDKARQAQLDRDIANSRDDKEQFAKIQKYTAACGSTEDVKIMAGTLPSLRDGVVVDASKTIVQVKASEEVKTQAGIAVAEQIANIAENRRLEVLNVTLNTNNEKVQEVAAPKVTSLPEKDQEAGAKAVIKTEKPGVITSLARVGHKLYASVQGTVVKGIMATKIEAAEKFIAEHEGDYAIENQLSILDSLLKSKHQAVRELSAENSHKFGEKNQVPATNMIVATGDQKVIQAGANNAHLASRSVQVEVAKTYFNTNIEPVQKTIAKNEGKFAKENQLEIYSTLMTSKHQEVLETAASNIYTMNKDNQLPAVNMTKETGNEGAINAAAAQVTKYDKECKAEIEKSLLELNNKKITETIQNAKAQAEEDAKAATEKAEKNKLAEAKAEETAKSNEPKTVTTNITANTPANLAKQVEQALADNKPIDDILAGASNVQIEEMIKMLPQNQLGPFLRAHGSEIPSDVFVGAIALLPEGIEKRKIVEDFSGNLSFAIKAQIGLLFDASSQRLVVNQSAKDGTLKTIDKNLLSAQARQEYDDLAKADKSVKFNQYC